MARYTKNINRSSKSDSPSFKRDKISTVKDVIEEISFPNLQEVLIDKTRDIIDLDFLFYFSL